MHLGNFISRLVPEAAPGVLGGDRWILTKQGRGLVRERLLHERRHSANPHRLPEPANHAWKSPCRRVGDLLLEVRAAACLGRIRREFDMGRSRIEETGGHRETAGDTDKSPLRGAAAVPRPLRTADASEASMPQKRAACPANRFAGHSGGPSSPPAGRAVLCAPPKIPPFSPKEEVGIEKLKEVNTEIP